MQLTIKDLLEIYELMILIRISELKMIELFKKGEIAGHMLPCAGQEAIPATFSKILTDDDILLTGHRGAGHYISRGCSFNKLWAELYGKLNGTTKGRGGQIHLIDIKKKAITGNAVVGAQWGIAAGAGFVARKEGTIVGVFGGEGSTNRGPFHESLNMCAVQKLPVLFVVEYNDKQMWNESVETTSVKRIADRAVAYGITGVTVDGNDPQCINKAATELIADIRKGGGPALLECITNKWSDSVSNVRATKEYIEYIKSAEVDCILRLEAKLKADGALDDNMDETIKGRCQNKLDEAIKFAKESDAPLPTDGIDDVYSCCD